MTAIEMKLELNSRIGKLDDENALARILKYVKRVSGISVNKEDLIDEIIANAPQDVPLTDDDIMQEIKAVRYAK